MTMLRERCQPRRRALFDRIFQDVVTIGRHRVEPRQSSRPVTKARAPFGVDSAKNERQGRCPS
jgi:hypothetical protein